MRNIQPLGFLLSSKLQLRQPLLLSSLILAGTAMVGMVGCGGSGTKSTASPFVGTWNGTYSSTGQSGTAAVVIASSGSFKANGYDNTAATNYSVIGFIAKDGTVSGTLTEGTSSVSLNGTWSISPSTGHLGGAVTVSSGTTTGATNIYDLTMSK